MIPFSLITILFLSLMLRLYALGDLPSGVLVDEASFGYIAYSLLETGKDEHGVSFPLTFTAFGDQKLPAYAYLLLPFVKLFGMNAFAVKLPSALAGTLFIGVVYLLLRQLKFGTKTAFVGTLVAAVSPWLLVLSRFGYESNLGLLTFTAGLLFLVRYLETKKLTDLVASSIFFGLTWYCYIAYRLTTVVFLGILGVYLFIRKKISPRQAVIFMASFIIIVLPLLSQVLSNQGTARLQQVGLFSEQGIPLEVDESRSYCAQYLPRPVCYLMINKGVLYIRELTFNVLHVFSPYFLFAQGEEGLEHLQITNFGLLPILTLPFFLFGFLFIYSPKRKKPFPLLPVMISIGMVASILPAILAGSPQRVRLSPLAPWFILLIASGFAYLHGFIADNKHKQALYLGSWVTLICYGIVVTISYLFVHIPRNEYFYGSYIQELSQYAYTHVKNEKNVTIQSFYSEPIMYYAFYNEISPEYYQENVELGEKKANGFQHAEQLGSLRMTEQPLRQHYCELKQRSGIFITNQDLEEDGMSQEKPAKIFTSQNGVMEYAYAYDVGEIELSGIICKEAKK